MAHYLLYFPGANEPDDNLIDQVGLNSLRSSGLPPYWHHLLAEGPDEGAGMILTWIRGDSDRDSDPSVQASFTWTPAKADDSRSLNAGRFWIGVDPERPVEPKDLELPSRFGGHEVLCGDGNKWHIPAAAKLPHAHGINADGEWERKVAAEYETFARRAMQYAVGIYEEVDAVNALELVAPNEVPEDPEVKIVLDDVDTHCCEALRMNYRVTPEIIDYLGLLDDSSMIGIISATIDLPEILAVIGQKKTYCPVGIPIG